MKFAEIPQFPQARYRIDVGIYDIKRTLEHWDCPEMGSPLILNPDWQRGHVWTKKQKISYLEYLLRGGRTGREIYFNCSSWQGNYNTPVYCVDGLQRITAALDFVENRIPAYGCLYKDYEDNPRLTDSNFSFNMMNVRNKRDLLQVYVDFNSGGTPHKPKEIARIIEMIEQTDPKAVL
jgi:hypothetical protein